jgi:putative (di)nucleoside polyphosphate hydrolase
MVLCIDITTYISPSMYRKGVSALICNNNQEFLLVNLQSFENKFFTIPGGGVEEGETLEEAAYREMQEELGIEKASLEYVGKSDTPLMLRFKTKKMIRNGIEYEGSERYFFGFLFVGTDDEIHLQEGEVRSYAWVSFADLGKYLLFDNQLGNTSEKIMELFPGVNKM